MRRVGQAVRKLHFPRDFASLWQPANPCHDRPARDLEWVPVVAWGKQADFQPRENRNLRVSWDIWPERGHLSIYEVLFGGRCCRFPRSVNQERVNLGGNELSSRVGLLYFLVHICVCWNGWVKKVHLRRFGVALSVSHSAPCSAQIFPWTLPSFDAEL